MPHRPVQQGPRQAARPEQRGEQADGGRAAQLRLGVHGEEDGVPALVGAVHEHHHDHDGQQQPVAEQVGVSLAEFGSVDAQRDRSFRLLRFGRSYAPYPRGDQQGRQAEGGRVQQQGRLRAGEGDKDAGQGRADHPGPARDRVEEAGGPGERGPGVLGQIRDQDVARGVARGVGEAVEGHQRAQHPEVEGAREVQQGDRRDGGRAHGVGRDGRAPAADPVDDGSADQRGDDDGQRGAERHDSGPGRAAGGLQDEPGDSDQGE